MVTYENKGENQMAKKMENRMGSGIIELEVHGVVPTSQAAKV